MLTIDYIDNQLKKYLDVINALTAKSQISKVEYEKYLNAREHLKELSKIKKLLTDELIEISLNNLF